MENSRRRRIILDYEIKSRDDLHEFGRLVVIFEDVTQRDIHGKKPSIAK